MIDLIATDGDGRLVSDLRAEEIEVQEGGKPQRVEFARLITVGGSAAPDAGRIASARPDANAATLAQARTAARGRLDAEPGGRGGSRDAAFDLLAHTREAVVKMARSELEPGTRLMLVTLDRGLQVRHPFTDDVERFAEAVEALMPSAGDGEAALADLIDQVEDTCDGSPGAVQNAIALGRGWVENARLGLTGDGGGPRGLARYLAPLPGRKHVVFYSAGYPMDPAAIAAHGRGGHLRARPAERDDRRLQTGSGEAQTALRVGAAVDSTGLLQAAWSTRPTARRCRSTPSTRAAW